MDNVTHSLVGVLLARAALPWVGSLRGAVWAAVLASNAPDLDLVLTPFFEDRTLGYLVHHRGHTHTLVGALLLALGVAAFARWMDPKARRGPIVALSIVGAFLHMGADWWNNYGVHPFWPFDDRWYYGDFVFILEPLLWMALLPLAMTTAGGRVRFGLFGLGLLLAGAVGFGLGAQAAAGWVIATTLLFGLQRRFDGVALPGVIALGALTAFGAGTRAAEAEVRTRMATARPAEDVLDVVLTPRAATPWCWQGIVLSTDPATYHARRFLLSLAPGLTAPADCALDLAEEPTAPLVPADLAADATVAWTGRWEAPVGGLAALVAESCRVDAATRFLRAPYWLDDGARILVGDLRYDREPGLGFAEVETLRTTPPDTRGCGNLPPWRSDVVRHLLAADPHGSTTAQE